MLQFIKISIFKGKKKKVSRIYYISDGRKGSASNGGSFICGDLASGGTVTTEKDNIRCGRNRKRFAALLHTSQGL